MLLYVLVANISCFKFKFMVGFLNISLWNPFLSFIEITFAVVFLLFATSFEYIL